MGSKKRPRTRVVEVTPRAAAKLLARGGPPRPLVSMIVARYADDMRAGRWMANVNPVAFDARGALLDGGHRLAAIVEADTPVRKVVATGVSAVPRVEDVKRRRGR